MALAFGEALFFYVEEKGVTTDLEMNQVLKNCC